MIIWSIAFNGYVIANQEDCHFYFRIGIQMQKLQNVKVTINLFLSDHVSMSIILFIELKVVSMFIEHIVQSYHNNVF